MIPPTYKNTQPKVSEMGIDHGILEELRATKTEIGSEIKDLGKELSAKIEAMSNSHTELRLEVIKTQAVTETKIAKLEKDTTALWDHSRELRREVSGCKQEMEIHKTAESATAKTKKGVSEWVRWIPGVILGVIAMILSLIKLGA